MALRQSQQKTSVPAVLTPEYDIRAFTLYRNGAYQSQCETIQICLTMENIPHGGRNVITLAEYARA